MTAAQQPRIEMHRGVTLIGCRSRMSFAQNTTTQLWQQFMPQRKAIQHLSGSELYSVEVYSADFFEPFDPNKFFDKWAAVAVDMIESLPGGMEILQVPAGLYAVFLHRGAATEAEKTYTYIFRDWLPASPYRLDHRPHFAVMDARYKKDNPDSEEEIWIPVQPK